VFIEESGTTEYAGALLRFYAAEGVVQGHSVHVVGLGEVWGRELPGLSDRDAEGKRISGKGKDGEELEKMKIAWRYEGLGVFGSRGAERGRFRSFYG
jgi:elongator complex protein 4